MSMLIRKRLALAGLVVLFALLGLVWAPVMAQDDVSDTRSEAVEDDDDDSASLERVQVTGSLIRRAEYSSTSPVQVISAETQTQVGQVSTSEFLQRSSIAAGSTQYNNTFGGYVIEGGTGVNSLSLRGLGAQRTLVLLNGRRPGPAGTRGQTGPFDLNVIPRVAVQRAEILKDGASSIYGSDAVAGVANIITRRNMNGGEVSIQANQPEKSGGAIYQGSAGYGWTFDRGSAMVAAEYFHQEALRMRDRDFLRCQQDNFFDADGNRIDREDRSILAGTDLAGCESLYANTVMDAFFGDRYIPAPDGVTIGMIPGYRPRVSGRYDEDGAAWYEDVLNFDFTGSETAINKMERMSLYGNAEYEFDFAGGVTWDAEWLYNRRETTSEGWRQFFPLIGGATAVVDGYGYANNPDFVAPVESGIAQPVMPYPSNSNQKVDYYYLASGIEGEIGNTLWTWRFDASYSRSDGDYTRNSIIASRSGDVQFDPNGPRVDYFDPCILSGQCMADLINAVGASHTGNTIYDQAMATAVVTGDLFDLPAGPLGVALGAEYRYFSIDDQPSDYSMGGDLWGESSALVTKGSDNVAEAFAEIEVPLVAGAAPFESLTLNASGRVFDYHTSGSSSVWKAGLNWQINPTLRIRGTVGTSYRTPALYELYLGDQTAFLGQAAVDPCILWGESNNDFLRANCAAAGIPEDFAGAAASATIVSGGGAGVLEPETSDAWNAGIILTPEFADFSLAVDYFEMTVKDQVSQLGAGGILGGCYGSPNFPNAFCDLFERNPGDHPTEPFKIETVYDSYLNVNKQKTRGVDVNFRYDHTFSIGRFVVENQSTWVFEDLEQLFDPSLAQGFDNNNRNGIIGRPKLVSNLRAALTRDDWTFTWYTEYIRRTSYKRDLDEETSYFGFEPAYRLITAPRGLINTVSVMYEQPSWSVLAGVRNLFNDKPPIVSDGAGSRRGNIPLVATQYDVLGRQGFVRFNYYF